MNWGAIDLKGKTSGSVKLECPVCHSLRKNKSDKSLSVNIDEGLYNCHNCGYSGNANQKAPKAYVRPEQPKGGINIDEKSAKWFLGRSISLKTLVDLKVGTSKEWIPQAKEERTCINFNYFREGKLINVKFRDGAKNFKMVKDAELIFYNLDAIDGSDECLIQEGEIDTLSSYEAGYKYSVSVPNGASKGNANLEYLDNCIKYFASKSKIIIATDNDEPGLMLRNELCRRLGKERCWILDYPDGCKDMNDVLQKYGKERVLEVIGSAYKLPIEGIISIDDIRENIYDIHANGYPVCDKIQYPVFDEHFSFKKGDVTVVTGIPNSGKSAFLDQICTRLASRCGWKLAYFSFENQPVDLHITKIASQFIGRPIYKENPNAKMSDAEVEYALQFISENYFFVNLDEIECTIDGILNKSRELVSNKGIDGIVIDPYNYIEHKRPDGMSETEYISHILTQVKRFALAFDMHVFIVAHPTKIEKTDGKFRVPNLYSISGSAHWFNKIDNGICVYRNEEDDSVDVYIQKVRWFFVGKRGQIQFHYDVSTNRYAELGYGFEEEYRYYFDVKQERQQKIFSASEAPF